MFFANQHIYIGESILTEKYEHNTFKWQLYLPEPIHLQINFVLTCNVKEDTSYFEHTLCLFFLPSGILSHSVSLYQPNFSAVLRNFASCGYRG